MTHKVNINKLNIIKTDDINIIKENNRLIIEGNFEHVFGFGERYHQIDHMNSELDNKVVEKFCYQGEDAYFPLPFFFTNKNIGFFIETNRVFKAFFDKNITIEFNEFDDKDELHIIKGTPQEMVSTFIKLTGQTLIPPKWAFGPWVSAHRWRSQQMISEQMQTAKSLGFPVSALVIEQWSDESTFYIFNDATYKPSHKTLTYDDFTFDPNGLWPNPKQMIKELHQADIKVLLWQVPVIKALEPKDAYSEQHALDQAYVVKNNLVVKEKDETPYKIPKGHWFPGSHIPDFSNPQTHDWWFHKRQYLLDIGIDGFKTDGGEFVYKEDLKFFDQSKGSQNINTYPRDYLKAYHQFVGKERVLFSRAGYLGQHAFSIQWAGDQKSTWEEFRSQYRAGINASLSGHSFWSFDIGGFAGDIPSYELYVRATQFAVFVPIMQFHSEPIGGQFALLSKSKIMNNERTPWNIAKQYNKEDQLNDTLQLYWLRMNLLPHIYSESIKYSKSNKTVMRHMMMDFDNDFKLLNKHEQYMFTNLLIAPVLYENQREVDVYFPEGHWHDLLTNKLYQGNRHEKIATQLNNIHVFIKQGDGIVLNLSKSNELPSKVDNKIDAVNHLEAWLFGPKGQHDFADNQYDFNITWENNKYTIKGNAPKELTILFK